MVGVVGIATETNITSKKSELQRTLQIHNNAEHL